MSQDNTPDNSQSQKRDDILKKVGCSVFFSGAAFLFSFAAFVVFGIITFRTYQASAEPDIRPSVSLFSREDSQLLSEAQTAVAFASEQINQYLSLLQTGLAVFGLVGFLFTIFGIYSGSELYSLLNRVRSQVQDLDLEKKQIHTLSEELDRNQDSLQKSIQAVSKMQFAVGQVDLGNLHSAQKILEEIHQQIPDDPVVNFFLGDVLVRQDDFKKGVEYLEKATTRGNFWAAKASYAYAKRVEVEKQSMKHILSDEYDQIDALFRDIYAAEPTLLDVQGESAFGAWASLHKNQGNINRAVEIYRHCASVTPQSSYPLINLGQLHLQYAGQTYEDVELKQDEGLDRFRQAYEKARIQMRINPTDHWPIFDAILSIAVLGETTIDDDPLKAISDFFQSIDDLRVIDSDRQKLRDSLEALSTLPDMPETIKFARDKLKPVQ